MVKTPLRYPGGKSRAVKHILPLLPRGTYASPFLGGGSIELELASRGDKVFCYDAFEPLINFWEGLKDNIIVEGIDSTRESLIDNVVSYALTIQAFQDKFLFDNVKPYLEQIRNEMLDHSNELKSYERGAIFFTLNRCSYSGSTCSGGFNKDPLKSRFTVNSIIKLTTVDVSNMEFLVSSFPHSIFINKDKYLYLDPPYLLPKNKNKLYGINGSLHEGFNHTGLRDILFNHTNFWLLSYNDCQEVRSLYEGCFMKEVNWSYGMNKNKKGNELLISNQPFLV